MSIFRTRLMATALLLPAMTVGSLPVAAETPPMDATTVLLQQARFWSAQHKPDQARLSLQRVLRLDPGNGDALADLALLEAAQGHRAAAEAALAKLRTAAPQDPRAGRVAGAIRVGAAPEALDEARTLAREGHHEQAVAQYDRLFQGAKPPADLAIEYDRALSATPGGWEAARDGLAALVRENPADLAAQLAYAETLTYRDGARADGIERLQALARTPAVAEAANRAWRAALKWLPESAGSAGPLEAYLAAHPEDAELAAKLEAARHPPTTPDPAGQARASGFAQLSAGRLADAATSFRQALAVEPANADALGGLGLVRLRQHDLAQARTLLAQAIARDPDHADRWQQSLAASGRRDGPNPAIAMLSRGDAAGAERELRAQLAHGEHDPGLKLMLAEAETRQGLLPEAERTLRDAIARRPGDGAAMVRLAALLDREGRTEDAAAMLAQAQAAGAGPLVAEAHAQHLRAQAQAATDKQLRLALLRAATEAAPSDPWIRLDLARSLVAVGRLDEARAVMARGVEAGAGGEAIRAGVIFARETRDTEAAIALLARLPASARTPDMRAAQAQADLEQEIAAAAPLDPIAARERLLALAGAHPDPDGGRGAAIATALTAAGQPEAAREAIAIARAATPGGAAVGARLAYAGALLDAGDGRTAQRLLAGLSGSPALTPQQRADLAQLRGGLAVRRSDGLNEQGQQAAAFDALAPALAAAPADPTLNLALARLYQGAKRPRDALAVTEAVLRRDPANAGARKQAVEAALAAGERHRAEVLVREAMQLSPGDPQSWLAAADLARAQGDSETALRTLRRARALRARQLDGSGSGDALSPSTVLALLDPPELQAADANTTETDEDGDQVFIRRRMLDTDATDLPPPVSEQTRAATPPAPVRPPIPVTMAASQDSGDAVDTGPLNVGPFSVSPFGRPAPPPPATSQPANPFRDTTPADNRAADTMAPVFAELAPAATPADPMTQRIDRDIAAVTDEASPSAQAAVGFRGRSGSAGTSQLAEITVPLDASYALGDRGRLRLGVTPTFLSAGSVPQDVGSQTQFGSLGLGFRPGRTGIASQTAEGAGLDLAYLNGSFSADIGSTPLGFQQQNVVGGLEWAPALGDGVRLRMTGERRAITDSLLSYAGTRDPQSGQKWGGVTYARGHANVEFTVGPADLYVGGGGGVLDGQNVKSNSEFEAGAGGSFAVWKAEAQELRPQELRLGLDLVYFGFARNLGGFTLGQGGYFSPQSYFAALVPITFKDRPTENLSYEIGATLGLQTYRQDSSPSFPNNASLQSALEAQQANPATAVQGVATSFPSKSQSGFTGGAHAAIDYRLTPAFHIGAKADYEHAGDFNQTVGLLYGRYVFNGAPR